MLLQVPGGDVFTVFLRLGYGGGGQVWLIRVTDNGSGIPEESRPHIFSRFYRVDKSNARAGAMVPGISQGSGAGLGLAIARWIAEIHYGTLVLEKSDPPREACSW